MASAKQDVPQAWLAVIHLRILIVIAGWAGAFVEM
jgi:hypothetical protein